MVEHTLKDSKVEMAETVFESGREGGKNREGEGGREMGLILSPTHS